MTPDTTPGEHGLRFRPAEPGEGGAWVRGGFTAFGKQPFGFSALFAVCLLVFVVLMSLPIVGVPLLVVVWPMASLLFMMASRRAMAGQRPFPDALGELAHGRGRYGELIKLGIASLLAGVAASFLVGWLDGDALGTFMDRAAKAQDREATEALVVEFGPSVLFGLILRLLVAAVMSVPLWHAPALVWWGRQRWAKSLFFSTVAIWRNRGAFTVYGMVWLAFGFGFMLVLGMLTALLGPAVGVTIAGVLVLLWWTLTYASLWFTYTGCFEPEATAPAAEPVSRGDTPP